MARPAAVAAQAGPPTVTGETFFAVQVQDVEESAAWYERVLGVVESNRLESDRYEIRILSAGGLAVELIELADGSPAPDRQPGLFKVGFFVDDIDGFHAFVRAEGERADPSIFTDEALGARSFVLRDPDGNRLQAFERCDAACARW